MTERLPNPMTNDSRFVESAKKRVAATQKPVSATEA